MATRVLLYSDCDFFAGCENMMAVIMNSRENFGDLNIEFAYRHSQLYQNGLKSRIDSLEGFYPLNLINFSGYFIGKNDFARKNMRRFIHILRFLLIPIIFIQNALVLYFFVKQKKIDVLFLNNGGYPGALSTRILALVGKLIGVKKIYMVVNNTALPYESILRRLSFFFDRMVTKSVDIFITGSENAGKALQKVLSVNRDRRIVIYNCIETSRFQSYLASKKKSNDKLIFTNIGLLEKRKGQIVLLNAIDSLITRRPELRTRFHINIEGEGREYHLLNDFIVNNHLEDLVTLLGNSRDIGEVYSLCDVFVLPSISNEDLPNVISEAMLFSKPIIASDLAGIPHQVIDGENGYLVSPGNIVELERAIEKCLDNRGLLEAMGKRSKEIFLEKFSVETALINYKKLFC